jgi:hypothetical protein
MTSDVDDQVDWLTHCPHCGTELTSQVVESRVTNDFDEGAPTPTLAVDVCPNPDCPGAGSDPGSAAQDT